MQGECDALRALLEALREALSVDDDSTRPIDALRAAKLIDIALASVDRLCAQAERGTAAEAKLGRL